MDSPRALVGLQRLSLSRGYGGVLPPAGNFTRSTLGEANECNTGQHNRDTGSLQDGHRATGSLEDSELINDE
ncbi:hypothetical protein GCM10023352_05890 [Rothia endophytica]|uniref:Uncharacterized protein n=1 Tax=Rothia endophytica TaxID=1324766 RepID=A0ABP9B4Y9_9MICC